MPRPGGGSIGHSKHRLAFGHPGHNRDVMQVARELNKENKKQNKIKENHKESMFPSVQEAFQANKKKGRRK